MGSFAQFSKDVDNAFGLGGGGGYNSSNDIDMAAWAQANRPKYLDVSQGYDQYKANALQKGPSAWYNLARNSNDLKLKDARDRGALEVAGQTAKARNDLAAGGGLSSGARERVAEGGAKNFMNMSQDLSRQNLMNDSALQMQDAQGKQEMVKGLAGIENTRNQQKNANDMQAYQAQLQAMAAGQQAKATAGSGKNGK